MENRNRPPMVHQLPEYAAYGYPPSYEYPLPADVAPAILADLHPWLQEIASLDPDGAHATLEARWSRLKVDSLVLMRDYLLDCQATSLVLTGTRGWLLCVDRHKAMNLVAPPLEPGEISRRQSQWHLNDQPLLADLLSNFGGLREDFAPGGGCFIDDQKWEGVTDSWMEVTRANGDARCPPYAARAHALARPVFMDAHGASPSRPEPDFPPP